MNSLILISMNSLILISLFQVLEHSSNVSILEGIAAILK